MDDMNELFSAVLSEAGLSDMAPEVFATMIGFASVDDMYEGLIQTAEAIATGTITEGEF